MLTGNKVVEIIETDIEACSRYTLPPTQRYTEGLKKLCEKYSELGEEEIKYGEVSRELDKLYPTKLGGRFAINAHSIDRIKDYLRKIDKHDKV